jgi:hypothetical protein
MAIPSPFTIYKELEKKKQGNEHTDDKLYPDIIIYMGNKWYTSDLLIVTTGI